jgi:hypothetical protein
MLPAFGQAPVVFQRSLDLGIKDPAVLDIALPKGDVSIMYSHEGQITIYATPLDTAAKTGAEEFLKNNLRIDQRENHVTIRLASKAPPPAFLYRIDVPFRTEVTSAVEVGNQKVMGITGPANISSGAGDIDAAQVRFAPLRARTGKGKISCSRVMQVDAETQSGNITLMEDGPSKAVVKQGPGRIEIGGARGSVEASTDGGSLHIKAVANGDWQLSSVAGNIRIELPPVSNVDLDASSASGQIFIERDGMENPSGDAHQFRQKVEGGKQIQARSKSGSITIQ